MAISKVTFGAIKAPKELPKVKVQTKLKNKVPELDEKMSTMVKLMIGASAVAGLIMLGIAGYRGKLGKGVKKMLSKNSDDIADKLLKRKSKTQNPEVESLRAEQPKTKTQKAEVESPKPRQPISTALRPVEEIDGSDFLKLEGQFGKDGSKFIKDANGNVVREFVPSDDLTRLAFVCDYDPKTGNMIKFSSFRNGKTLDYVVDHDPKTGNEIKLTSFQADGKKVSLVTEYDRKCQGKEIQTILYKEDGITVDYITVPVNKYERRRIT